MTYDLLLIGGLDLARLRLALAALAGVPVEDVDVCPYGVMERNWKAAVLCTYEPVEGDVSWSLDIYLAESAPKPALDEIGQSLAMALETLVLYESQSFPPSAYWLVEPNGSRTRARVEDDDRADATALIIDAVERPIELLPNVGVEAQPEVIREHRMATPIADAFREQIAADPSVPADDKELRAAESRLAAWEAMTVRMASGWPPDGWYPLEYYRDDLAIRDRLAVDVEQIPSSTAARFTTALARIDEAFRAGTRESDPDSPEPGWWWRRAPEPPPWPAQP